MNLIPAVLVFILALFGSSAWYYLEQNTREQFIFGGMPERIESGWEQWYRVLRNDGFMVGYSDWRRNPLWVTYWLQEVTPAQKQQRYKRPGGFDEDWRTLWRVGHKDYTHSGYDRGHLAPNYAVSRLYGREAQLETFLMTNIVPQKPDLNRKVWQRLEEVAVDHFTGRFSRVAVMTGPVFDQTTTWLDDCGFVERLYSLLPFERQACRIEVPDAFYKIFVGVNQQGQAQSMLAFLLPQTVKGSEPLTKFVVSVDQVEALTGFDFFSRLNDTDENRLEALQYDERWQLRAVARQPSRF